METELGAFWRNRQRRSLVLVIIASILEKADVAAVPAVYRELGLALNVSPAALGSFKLVQMLTQTVFSPFAGFLALRYKRTRVIAAGAFVSTIASFSIGLSTTFPQIAFAIALNSMGVAVTWPLIQSLVADTTDESNRGTTFGWLQLIAHVGSFFGGVTAVLLAGTTVMGVSGWRVAFFIMSALSSLISISLLLFADDPHQVRRANFHAVGEEAVKLKKSPTEDLKEVLEDARRVLGLKTFQIIVVQAMIASIAWSALSFSSMWLELTGFSHPQTATIAGFFVIAGSLGGLFGGFMGDRMYSWLPDVGRIILGQFSTGSAVPFTTILLLCLPHNPSSPFLHGLVFFVMGCCINWTAPATNYPIMAEIVPAKSRTNIYALEKGFVSILAAFSSPLVGIMSEKIFGYVPVPKGADGDLLISMDRKNAAALGKAMYACAGLPFLLCCLLFTPLYWSYPKDRDRVRDHLATDEKLNFGVRLEEVDENYDQITAIRDEEEALKEEEYFDNDEESHILLHHQAV